MLRAVRIRVSATNLVGALLVSLLCLGCSEAKVDATDVAATNDAAQRQAKPSKVERARRDERPLPAFSGRGLDGQPIDVADYIGRRLIVAFVNPEIQATEPTVQALVNIAPLRGKHNFGIIGVAVGSDRAEASAFARRLDIEFPMIDDSAGQLTRRFGLRGPVTLLGVDAEGYVIFGSGGVGSGGEEAVRAMEAQLREDLRLPPADHEQHGPGLRPEAPLFSATLMEGGTFSLEEQRGKAVILLFFLHTCPHCHDVLAYLKEELARLPDDKQPVMVGLELTGKTSAVRAQLAKDELDFFPVAFDDAMTSVQKAYGVFAGVPDMVLIDAEGRIAHRVHGWAPKTDAPLTRMRIARLVGAPVPMLLSDKGYTGSEVCGVCHESEHQTWQLTSHASAYDTLVTHGSDTDAECVSCHVVGFGKPEGFEMSPRSDWLEDVGCEMCHGRGGPHRSPDFMETTGYEQACLQCHDAKHSLGFDFASFVPRISHAANRAILELPPAERQRVLAERGAVRKSLLPTQAPYVGSEACKSCHAAEYETWSQSPHAGAAATLAAEDKGADADCLRCHTTGMGSAGGFPSGAAATDHADLARVGCESCHGPGGDHIVNEVKLGNIVSLGDKCDSCVILQICGSCHDDANDPGFEFEVQDKIDAIRHGTIEAGTGTPLKGAGQETADARTAIADVFAWIDAHEPASGRLEAQR
jgi:peroxiredoxin